MLYISLYRMKRLKGLKACAYCSFRLSLRYTFYDQLAHILGHKTMILSIFRVQTAWKRGACAGPEAAHLERLLPRRPRGSRGGVGFRKVTKTVWRPRFRFTCPSCRVAATFLATASVQLTCWQPVDVHFALATGVAKAWLLRQIEARWTCCQVIS